MKENNIFAVSYIPKGGLFCLLVSGIFYCSATNIYGSEPPCKSVMDLLPLGCMTTGKAEPFFLCHNKQFLSVMSYTEKKGLNGQSMPNSDKPPGATSGKIPQTTIFKNRIIDGKLYVPMEEYSYFKEYSLKMAVRVYELQAELAVFYAKEAAMIIANTKTPANKITRNIGIKMTVIEGGLLR